MYFSRDYYWWYQNSFGKHLRTPTSYATQQVVFLRDVSKEFLIPYANDNLVLGGYFNHTINTQRNILARKLMILEQHWYQVGIKQVSDLFDFCEGHLLPFNSFCNKFNVKCNFLQYYSILSSIPQIWKRLLQEGSKDPVTPPTTISSLSCKAIYSILLNLEYLPPPISEKKLLASGIKKSDYNKIYLLQFKVPMKWNLSPPFYSRKLKSVLHWFIIF